MSQPEDDDPSFDPRTWLKPGESKAAVDSGKASAEPSYDPKSWTLGAGSPVAEAGLRRSGRWAFLGGGAIVLALALGALVFGLAGRKHGAATPASAANPAATDDRRSLVIPSPDALPAVLASTGAPSEQVTAASAAAIGALGQQAGEVQLELSLRSVAGVPSLVKLEAHRADGSGVLLVRGQDGAFTATPLAASVRLEVKDVRGEMDANDFYSSAVAAGIPDSLIHDFAQALTFDFDFQREVKQGDIFEGVVEQGRSTGGQAIGAPRLLFVLMTTQAKSVALYQFQAPGQSPGWFDGSGRSVVRAFMRTPVEGARITSTFGMREHPILGFSKQHNGVDFAAPVGTPIYAASDGVVAAAEFKALNGNYVAIVHDNGWRTLYLHMQGFAPGVAAGLRVRQGQPIGQVGLTGRTTGPHLHYELHMDNMAVDPMSVPLGAGSVLSGQVLAAFYKERDRVDAVRSGGARG